MAEVNLYVSGINTANGTWTAVGTTPYLNAQDQPTNYIHDAERNSNSDIYDFSDSSDLGTITKVELFVYAVQGGAASDFEAYVNSTATGLNPPAAWGWVSVDVTSIVGTTWAGVNAATVYFDKPNTTNDPSVDAAYLKVTYTAAVTHSLGGNPSATATVTGDMDVSTSLAGNASATATTTGLAKRILSLAGSVVAAVTTTGSSKILTTLAGAVLAASPATTANLTVETSAKLMDGTASAVVTTVGDLKVDTTLAGSVSATSTTYGDFEKINGLSGSVTASSTTVGDADIVTTLAGVVSASSPATTAALTVSTAFTLRTDYWFVEIGGVVIKLIDGTVSAVASVLGDLDVLTTLQGSISAAITVTGDLDAQPGLAGSVSSLVTTIGDVEIITGLQGTVSAASTTSGDAKILTTLQASVSATATPTGSLTILGEPLLQGTVSATATPTGALSVETELIGTSAAVSVSSGSLSVETTLAGSVSATSTTVGDADIITGLQGSISSVATVTGIVDPQPGLAGSVSATTTTIGDVEVLTELQGAVSASVTTEGDLSVAGQALLEGTSSAVATITGDLGVLTTLQGTSSAVATITGDADVLTTLQGSVSATVTTEGDLTVAGEATLSGTAQATVTTIGDLDVTTTLSGITQATVTTIGDLDVLTGLAGTISAAGTVSGDLTAEAPMAGTISAAGTVSGDLTVELGLSGTVSASSSVTGFIAGFVDLAGTVSASGSAAGALRLSGLLGEVQATSTVTGDLTHYDGCIGEVQATSTVTGDLTTQLGLQGTISAAATVTGELLGIWQGWIQAAATVSGNIEMTLSLAGEVSASATVQGGLQGAHVELRGYCPVHCTPWGTLNAFRGEMTPSWIPTDTYGSKSITDWEWTIPNVKDEYLLSVPLITNPTPGYSPFETALSVVKPLSFLDDFYYRIHVNPNPIDAGAIVGDTDFYVWVWNAFPYTSKVLTDVIKTGDPLTVVSSTPPKTFVPLWYEQMTLQVPGAGNPTFEAEVEFEFDSGATYSVPVLITGNRVALLNWRPQKQWLEELITRTDVLRAGDGTEQRIEVRPTPRQRFRVRLLLDEQKDATMFDVLLHRWQKLSWALPMWHEYENHVGGILSTDTTINVNTTTSDFRDDSLALIWKSNSEYTIVSVDTVNPTSITLKNSVGQTFSGRKAIVPLRIANMISRSMKKQFDSGVVELGLNFQVIDNIPLTGYSAPTTYDGLEVVTTPTGIDPAHFESSDPDVFVNDFETGIVEFVSYSQFNKHQQNHIWRNDTKQDAWNFRKFLHDKHGMQKPFLVPTFRRDLVLSQNIGPSDTYIYVENVGMATHMGTNNLRTYVGFLVDGQLYVRKILNMVQISSTKERFDIDAILGFSITMGNDYICWIDKVRFASDSVEIRWDMTGRNECSAPLMRVT